MPRKMPEPSDYKTALQSLDKLILVRELKPYQCIKGRNGTPLMYSGGFAMTSPIRHPQQGKKLALRFFYRLPDDIEQRYMAITEFIRKNVQTGLFAEVTYADAGVTINGQKFPICYMEWVEGETLRKYVEKNLNNPAKIKSLADKFQQLIEKLYTTGAAHGDLSHENIMVRMDELVLVDYDGMFVPALRGLGPCVVGQPNFQHPQRAQLRGYFGNYQDKFSSIAIYLSLLSLQFDTTFYNRYENGGNSLLFTKEDFVNPDKSSYLKEMERYPALATLARNFREVCKNDLTTAPSLKQFLHGKTQLTGGVFVGSLGPVDPDIIFTSEGNPIFAASSPNQDRLKRHQGYTGTLGGRIHRVRQEQDAYILEFWSAEKLASIIFIVGDAFNEMKRKRLDTAEYQGQWVLVTGVIQVSELDGVQEPSIEIDSLGSIRKSTREEVLRQIGGQPEDKQNQLSKPPPTTWTKVSTPPPPKPTTIDDLFKNHKKNSGFDPLDD